MGNRCPSCQTFVPTVIENVEVLDEVLNPDWSVSVTVRVVKTCEQCDEELAELELTLEGDFEDVPRVPVDSTLDDDIAALDDDDNDGAGEGWGEDWGEDDEEVSAEDYWLDVDPDPEVDEDCQPADRPARFQRRIITVSVVVNATCEANDDGTPKLALPSPLTLSDSFGISDMDDLT